MEACSPIYGIIGLAICLVMSVIGFVIGFIQGQKD